jgi:tRNA threonylcarbamoyladenosine biosynthesis protein TsaE
MSIYDKLRVGVTTASAAESQAIAAEFAAALPATCTLALHGDLGVGKTTFVQGLAHGFGITENVTSPTFNIYTVHRAPPSRSDSQLSPITSQLVPRTLVHLDAYRLETAAQIESLLLEDFLNPPWCLAVEWPEKISAWIPADTLHLDLGITADEHHTIRLR